MDKGKKNNRNVLGKIQGTFLMVGFDKAIMFGLLTFLAALGQALFDYFTGTKPTFTIVLLILGSSVSICKAIMDYVIFVKQGEQMYLVDPVNYEKKQLNKIKNQCIGDEIFVSLDETPFSLSKGCYVISKEINEFLVEKSDKVELSNKKGKYIIPFEVRRFVPFTLRAKLFDSNQIVFNQQKIRLQTEPRDFLTQDKPSASIKKTDYFTTVSTNEFALKKIQSRSSLLTNFDGKMLLFDSEEKIYPYHNSFLGNHIGISTLAVTSDNFLVLGVQGKRAHVNPDLIVPSGSGSLDFKDYHRDDNLRTMLVRGMERELREECNLDKKTTITTAVIGFLKVSNRGNKPDFIGISRIDCDSKRLMKRIDKNREIKKEIMSPPILLKLQPDSSITEQAVANFSDKKISTQLHAEITTIDEHMRQGRLSDFFKF